MASHSRWVLCSFQNLHFETPVTLFVWQLLMFLGHDNGSVPFPHFLNLCIHDKLWKTTFLIHKMTIQQPPRLLIQRLHVWIPRHCANNFYVLKPSAKSSYFKGFESCHPCRFQCGQFHSLQKWKEHFTLWWQMLIFELLVTHKTFRQEIITYIVSIARD